MTEIPNNVFIVWFGKMPEYIAYCIRTIKKRCGCKVYFITEKNVNNYLQGIDLNPNWRQITWRAQSVDCLRLALLYKYGGCWIDADTVMLKPIKHLFKTNADIKLMKWRRTGRILNGYFLARQNSVFLRTAIDWVNDKLATAFKTSYHEHGGVLFGECLFLDTYSRNKNLVEFMDLDTFLPVEFPFNQSIWYKRIKIEQFLKTHTVAIGLNHSQYTDNHRNRPIALHIRDGNLFGNIFKYSMSLGTV